MERPGHLFANLGDARDDGRGDPPPQVEPTAEPQSSATAKQESGGSTPALRFPQHLVSRGSSDSDAPRPLTQVDQVRFVNRVARAFEAASNRDGEVRLRLSPPELGSMRLEVKMQGAAMTARIETETMMARNVLVDSLPVLRERLAEQGIRVEQFEVDVPDRQQGQLPDAQGQQHQSNDQPATASGGANSVVGEEASTVEDSTTQSMGDNSLNVIV